MKKKHWVAPFVGVCAFLSYAKPEQVMYGNVNIHDTSISNAVKIIGTGSIRNAVVENELTVYGMLNAKNSRFLSGINLTGSDLTLTTDFVDGDVHITNYLHRPKLVLKGTTITGSVVFHGLKDGIVEMDVNSKIHNGIEKGGVIS